MFGRDSVEPGLSKSLTERNSELRDLFEVKWVKMKKKIKKDEEDFNDPKETVEDIEIGEGYTLVDRPVVNKTKQCKI